MKQFKITHDLDLMIRYVRGVFLLGFDTTFFTAAGVVFAGVSDSSELESSELESEELELDDDATTEVVSSLSIYIQRAGAYQPSFP